MAAACCDRDTGVMPRPRSFSRFLLLLEDRPAVAPAAAVRRYRLAELRVPGRRPAEGDRYGHLKRVYD